MTNSISIFPSQVPVVAFYADELAKQIQHSTNIKLSTFNRRDAFAKALGYKGFADLGHKSKARASADNKEDLHLFPNNDFQIQLLNSFLQLGKDIPEESLDESINLISHMDLSTQYFWNEKLDSIKGFFPDNKIQRHYWTDINEIAKVLSKFSGKYFNHLFYPTGGGADLIGAKLSIEPGNIELQCDRYPQIIKPEVLYFEPVSGQFDLSYFRLEASTIKQTSVYKNLYDEIEELAELSPGNYAPLNVLDFDEYQGEAVPSSIRHVVRRLRGSFVIFCKSSLYNNISDTYDGRHDKMSSIQFLDYVKRLARAI